MIKTPDKASVWREASSAFLEVKTLVKQLMVEVVELEQDLARLRPILEEIQLHSRHLKTQTSTTTLLSLGAAMEAAGTKEGARFQTISTEMLAASETFSKDSINIARSSQLVESYLERAEAGSEQTKERISELADQLEQVQVLVGIASRSR